MASSLAAGPVIIVQCLLASRASISMSLSEQQRRQALTSQQGAKHSCCLHGEMNYRLSTILMTGEQGQTHFMKDVKSLR